MADKTEEDAVDELEADCDESVWISEFTWLKILSKLPSELQIEFRPPTGSMDGRFVVIPRVIWLLVSELAEYRNFDQR